MAYENRKRDFSREHIYIVEIDGDYCALEYGVAPCTAEVGVTGSDKCYNTFVTCQDTANYDEEGITYRFCESVSPHPIGLNGVIPSVSSVNITPAEINPGGGLGVRSSVTISFRDHPYHDRGIDKYVDERSYIASDRGTYWTKWRARNPFYQGYNIRVISAYLEDGEYKAENGQSRHYIMESLDVSNGRATIRAKDPLKALDNERAKIPEPSTGLLNADITAGATSFTVKPSGAGAQYTAGDYVRIGREVILVDSVSTDTLTVTRAQYNTEAEAHDQEDTVQLCKEYDSELLQDIINDIITSVFSPSSPFLAYDQWTAEAENFLPGAYSALITEPTGATKLLNELGTTIPHSLYWDERDAKFYIKAIRSPSATGTTVTEDGEIISDIRIKDMQDLRRSTIYVFFGQIDPTEKLDEGRNFRQVYVREDTDSVSNYGSRKVKEVFSRWIENVNKAAAIRCATRWGRRYSDVPRQFTFTLAPKDSGLWAGEPCFINHREITDFSGLAETVPAQVTSVKQIGDSYEYVALEHLYGPSLPDDEEPGVNDIVLSGQLFDIDLLEVYEDTVGTPDGSTAARVIIETSAIIGSTSISSPAIRTGTWPAGATIEIINNGFVVGKGGKGGEGTNSDHTDGGDAFELQHPITLDNQGVIGGGGGGGSSDTGEEEGETLNPGGGGGAGSQPGAGGNSYSTNPLSVIENGEDGTLELGGDAGTVDGSFSGFDGGDLGQDASTGGVAGYAIRQNGNTVTYTTVGDIRGTTA